MCGAKPPEAEFLACYIGFSVALDSEAPRFLVVYENLSLVLLFMCFLLAGRYCIVNAASDRVDRSHVGVFSKAQISGWYSKSRTGVHSFTPDTKAKEERATPKGEDILALTLRPVFMGA